MIAAAESEFGGRKCFQGRHDVAGSILRGVHPQSLRSAAERSLILNSWIFDSGFGKRGAQFVFGHFLFESKGSRIAAEEIDAEGALASGKTVAHTDEDQQPGDDKCGFGQPHEIEFGRANEVQHRHRFEPAPIQQPIEDQARHHERCK